MKSSLYKFFYFCISIIVVSFICVITIKYHISNNLKFSIVETFSLFTILLLVFAFLFLAFLIITEKDNSISLGEAKELREFFIISSFYFSLIWILLTYLIIDFKLTFKNYEKSEKYYQIEKEIDAINKIEREINKDKILEEEKIEKIKKQILDFYNLGRTTNNEKILEKIDREIDNLKSKLPKDELEYFETTEEKYYKNNHQENWTTWTKRVYYEDVEKLDIDKIIEMQNFDISKQKEIEELRNRIKELENSVN